MENETTADQSTGVTASANPTFHFEITKAELIKEQKDLLIRWFGRMLIYLVFLFGAGIIIGKLIGGIIAVVFFFGSYLVVIIHTRRLVAHGNLVYDFGPQGIHIIRGQKNRTYPWNAFKGFRTLDETMRINSRGRETIIQEGVEVNQAVTGIKFCLYWNSKQPFYKNPYITIPTEMNNWREVKQILQHYLRHL